jgi:Helix-turn-helix
VKTKKKSLVDQLRASIRSACESEYAVAKAANVDNGVLSRFMRGKRGISLKTAAKICAHLQLVLADAKKLRRQCRKS